MAKGFLNPEEVLNQLILRDNMVAVEFGCGSGGFAIPLAKRLDEGRVFGLDIQEEPLSALKSRATLENISNIVTIRCNLEIPGASTFQSNFFDLVLIPNLLFQAENKRIIIEEAKRILRPKGEIVVVDWLPTAALGPKEGRVSPKEIKEIAKNLSLKLKKEFVTGKYHYGLVFTK